MESELKKRNDHEFKDKKEPDSYAEKCLCLQGFHPFYKESQIEKALEKLVPDLKGKIFGFNIKIHYLHERKNKYVNNQLKEFSNKKEKHSGL